MLGLRKSLSKQNSGKFTSSGTGRKGILSAKGKSSQDSHSPNLHPLGERKVKGSSSGGEKKNVCKRKVDFDLCQEDFRNSKKERYDFSDSETMISAEPEDQARQEQ